LGEADRLADCRERPYEGMAFNDPVPTLRKEMTDGVTLRLDEDPNAQNAALVVRGLVEHTESECGVRQRDARSVGVFAQLPGGEGRCRFLMVKQLAT
jgi:hypothetical protein